MRLRSYLHRGRHRAAAGRPTVTQIEFIERVHLPVEHGGIWLQPWPDADRRVP